MKKFFMLSFCLLALSFAVSAQEIDPAKLDKIGSVTGFTKTEKGITLDCDDHSQVELTVLASDLVRVRAAFTKPIPARDHSWAIAKENWETPPWRVVESGVAITIVTAELEVVVHRSPLLIDFRDARTHEIVNADEQPMAYDGHGALKNIMFDPSAGTFVAAAKKLGFDEHFYGLGEKAAHLDKRRGFFVNWNSDTPGYREGRDPIYQTIPFYLGLQRGAAYGIFFDNSYRSYFDFARLSQERIWFGAEGGELNYYFFYGPSIKKILGRYADLTGHMPLTPLWALGVQQCRYSYYPQSVVEEVVRQYRERDLPLDVIYLDIHYMNGYRVFTFDANRFPDPKALTEKLAKQGVKTVVIVDPGVKYQPPVPQPTPRPGEQPAEMTIDEVMNAMPGHRALSSQEKSYYVFDEGLAANYFQKRKSGRLFIPRVWPGDSVFVDFTLPEARRWWGDLHQAYTDNGIAGIWNDMNEPADFVDQSGKNQLDVVSYDEGENSTHAKNRNVFALLMARATYEGLARLNPDRRPFVITRAGYAGIQRYSTMWTGDTNSTWDALALNVPMFTTLGLSGEPFVGSDVGGFIGRADGEFLVRSYQIGFLAPFFRNHHAIDGYDQEPWRFGKYYEDIIRKYLKLRYELLPFLYTSLEAAHRTGVPLFRPLMLNYQNDENTYNLDDEFMIGDDLLVAPVVKPDVTSRLVYLPQGTWYDFWTNKKYSGGTMVRAEAPLETVPMFVRGGAIIPLAPSMNYVGEKKVDPITFAIYPDEKGSAATILYEDDGNSLSYLQGSFRRTKIEVRRSANRYIVTSGAPAGSYNPGARKFVFVIKPGAAMQTISVVDEGKARALEIK
jgi:alpha-glucosidase